MKDTSILTNNGINVQQSLELFGDMEMYDETLGDFLDMSDEKITSLENYKNANDMPNYAIAVHALKSDARYLGFTTLADLSYESEMKSKAGDSVFVAENHPKILQEAKRVINLSQQYMGRELTAVIPESAATTAQPVAEPVPVQPVANPAPVMEQTTTVQPVSEVAPVAVQPEMVQPQMVAEPVQQVVMPATPVVETAQPQVEYNYIAQSVAPVSAVEAAPVQPVAEVVPMANVAPVAEQPLTPQPVVMENTPVPAQPAIPVAEVTPTVQAGTEVQINFSNAAEPAALNQVVQPSQPVMMENTQVPAQPAEPTIQFFPADDFQHQDIMNQALSMQEQAQQTGPEAVKQGIILVVDDSPLVANFVKKIFSKSYDVLIAHDGQKAIEIINDDNIRSQIKTCLLDLNMPNVSGFDVMDHFREKGFFVRTPVAIISGAEDDETLDKAKSYPIIDVLAKPFNERDVQRVVEKCLAVYF